VLSAKRDQSCGTPELFEPDNSQMSLLEQMMAKRRAEEEANKSALQVGNLMEFKV
jgi:hypothetical protein